MSKIPKRSPSNTNGLEGDQESMQKLKQSAGYIVTIIALALAGYFGWEYFQNASAPTDTVAADKYANIDQSNKAILAAQDPSNPIDADAYNDLNMDIDSLVAEHGSTIYAWQALMIKARNATDTDQLDIAAEALKKALSIDLKDPGLLAITQLRYATVLLGSGNVDEALKQAKAEVPLEFEASQQELLGDIYLVQEDNDKAVRAYENAWSLLSKRQEERINLRLKLENLGFTPEPIDAKPAMVDQSTTLSPTPDQSVENELDDTQIANKNNVGTNKEVAVDVNKEVAVDVSKMESEIDGLEVESKQ